MNDLVRAVAFVALCKEWFGEGVTGNQGVSTAVDCTADPDRREEFAHLWELAGDLAVQARGGS